MRVPEGWEICSLSEVAKEKISYGIVQAGPHVEEGMPYIKSSDVGGKIIVPSLQKTSKEIHYKYRRSSVHPGDIIFSLRGNIGEISIVPNSLPEANLTQGTARISVATKHDRFFIYHQLSSERLRAWINKLSKGSTFKEISLEELRKVQIPIAPIQEQQKIAQILSTWDKAIEKLEALIAAKQKRKKALMQRLLTGKKRFAGFGGEWTEVRLGDLLKGKKCKGKIVTTNAEFKGLPYIGSTSFEGVFGLYSDSDEAITCTSTDILILWDGENAGKVTTNLTGVVSSTVVRCRLKANKANNQFIAYRLLKDNYKIRAIREGSGIPHMPGDFEHWYELQLPTIEEQKKIASVLSAADTEIQTHQNQLSALKEQKKGLMQQLLTGKKRVKLS